MFWFQQGQRELNGDCVFIQPVDGGGLLIPAASQQTEEYLWGGEYEEPKIYLMWAQMTTDQDSF